MPFALGLGDPFDRLMTAMGVSDDSLNNFLPASDQAKNIQPGCKGVWLSRQLYLKLASLGVDPRMLNKPGQPIRTLSREYGWHNDRYWGYSKKLSSRTAASFFQSNNAFAKTVWGEGSWSNIFPAFEEFTQCIYTDCDAEKTAGERDELIMRCLEILISSGNSL
jgi:hypothetical protein